MPGTITVYSRSWGLLSGKDNPRYASTGVAVTPAGVNVVFFPALTPGNRYQIDITKCINAAGEKVGFKVTTSSLTGFSIRSVENATFDYRVDVY